MKTICMSLKITSCKLTLHVFSCISYYDANLVSILTLKQNCLPWILPSRFSCSPCPLPTVEATWPMSLEHTTFKPSPVADRQLRTASINNSTTVAQHFIILTQLQLSLALWSTRTFLLSLVFYSFNPKWWRVLHKNETHTFFFCNFYRVEAQ